MNKRLKTPFKTIVTVLAAFALFAYPSASGVKAANSFEAHYTTASVSMQEQSAGNLVNLDRSNYSLAPLTLDSELCRIARLKSEDMRDNKYFAHTSPTYGDVRSMLTKMGYSYTAAGENIAHHATVEKAQAALISSPGHRRNIRHCAGRKRLCLPDPDFLPVIALLHALPQLFCLMQRPAHLRRLRR